MDRTKGDERSGARTQEAGPPADEKKKVSGIRFGIRLKFSLAIISLVCIIIISMTLYFLWRESNILKRQVIEAVDREVAHLANTAQQSIGVDELSIVAAINSLKKIDYIKYAFVLDGKDMIIQYFDRRKIRTIDKSLDDHVARNLDARATSDNTVILNVPDPNDPQGRIYDFSKTVLNKLDRRKIGAVIIGLSDIVIRNERRDLIKFIIPISLIFLAISVAGAVVLASITIRPVKALTKGAEIIGKGDLDYRIEIKTRDELGRLAGEFNQMTAQIKEAKEKEIESRIMEEQIEMAKEIQEGLNPMGYYEKGGIQLKGYTKAARGVGGDYFDYIDINDDKVGALISDVSGKGVPASLVMVMIRTVFTSYISRSDVSCASVVRAINDSLGADFAIDKFATLFFMIYDRTTEELSFSNAGHGPLFCYRASMKTCTVSKLDGVPIGIMEDSEYKQARVKLNPGDIVVLYTDGVTEMRNAQQEEYGMKRVQRLIVDNHGLNADQIVELMVNNLEQFRGDEPPHDDTTMLVLKRIS
jgi:serine phosphatase RsbU (regulator of sigma subunit)